MGKYKTQQNDENGNQIYTRNLLILPLIKHNKK